MSVIEAPRISGEPSGDEVAVSGVDVASIDRESFTNMGLNPVEHTEPNGEAWIEWVDPLQKVVQPSMANTPSATPTEKSVTRPETAPSSPEADLGQFVLSGHFKP